MNTVQEVGALTLNDENEIIINDIAALRAFIITLEWLLALMKRFSCPLQFDLVQIECGHYNELGDAYGALEACKQLSAVTASMKAAFRETDIVARNGTDFWVIAPYTYDEDKIYDKVIGIIGSAKHHGLNMVDREITIYPLPLASVEAKKALIHASVNTPFKSPVEAPLKALEFLEYLKNNKQQFASHVFRVPASG